MHSLYAALHESRQPCNKSGSLEPKALPYLVEQSNWHRMSRGKQSKTPPPPIPPTPPALPIDRAMSELGKELPHSAHPHPVALGPTDDPQCLHFTASGLISSLQ